MTKRNLQYKITGNIKKRFNPLLSSTIQRHLLSSTKKKTTSLFERFNPLQSSTVKWNLLN